MQNSRLGCFTITGIVAALITAAIIAVTAFTQGGVLYSPGALNAQSGKMLGGVTSHAEIGGNCKVCHAAPWSSLTMADLCTSCHVDVAVQMRQVASLHGTMTSKNPRLNCAACHPDHRGADASLTVATTADFPHESLGYSLNGHQFKVTREAFLCSDCHADDITTFRPTVCADCHRQMDAAFTTMHETSWGSDCLSCHDGVDTYGDDFDHGRFAFPLTGKHVAVSCYDCHANAHTIPDLQAASQTCADCHWSDDAHAGRFGSDCAACHSPDGWQPARFDHNLSTFKLVGKHMEADCEDCHKNNVYQGTPSDCYSCHAQDDEHNGQFGRDCAACHTPSDWENATFDHSLSNFPLTGAHQQIDCEKCHVNAQFADTPSDCYSCHAQDDEHGGKFGTDCAACHTPSDWDNATFDHNRSNFPLTGAHQQIDCEKCHVNAQFADTPSDCYSCHAQDDEHGGKFGTDCAACHTPSDWDNATFDHNRSNFPLTGAHQQVNCENCHANSRFAGTPNTCVACHADPVFHAGAFGAQCESCHTTFSWSPATFNLAHPQPAVDEHGSGIFHGGTTCRGCHPSTVYTYTCLACHSDNQGGEGGEDD